MKEGMSASLFINQLLDANIKAFYEQSEKKEKNPEYLQMQQMVVDEINAEPEIRQQLINKLENPELEEEQRQEIMENLRFLFLSRMITKTMHRTYNQFTQMYPECAVDFKFIIRPEKLFKYFEVVHTNLMNKHHPHLSDSVQQFLDEVRKKFETKVLLEEDATEYTPSCVEGRMILLENGNNVALDSRVTQTSSLSRVLNEVVTKDKKVFNKFLHIVQLQLEARNPNLDNLNVEKIANLYKLLFTQFKSNKTIAEEKDWSYCAQLIDQGAIDMYIRKGDADHRVQNSQELYEQLKLKQFDSSAVTRSLQKKLKF